ncbi:Highly reducing polyketide synthase lcsB [Frankliniella fusca]|uniref:Highly reducing polyketide synthase lcsB n=1 Tax=Frankliniella fusca TaxID=407009 RepID=A0AAE1HEH3_9NEOP|nr:Highly reducing polyketide synthase lcsB [Frankliniella fusca]
MSSPYQSLLLKTLTQEPVLREHIREEEKFLLCSLNMRREDRVHSADAIPTRKMAREYISLTARLRRAVVVRAEALQRLK